ncbi:hypothetical protein EDD11_009052 [Mortierella claussenii]|nr:hypothetical protein EDD11_009052 [Mortierella claussenii]
MEPQQNLSNPWSFQQQHVYNSEDDEAMKLAFAQESRVRRRSNDYRHYSYASSTTLVPDALDRDQSDEDNNADDDKHTDNNDNPAQDHTPHKLLLKLSKRSVAPTSPTRSPLPLQSASSSSAQAHGSTLWLTVGDMDPSTFNTDQQQGMDIRLSTHRLTSVSTSSNSTAMTVLQTLRDSDNPMEPSLPDAGLGPESDILEHLVQRLQSEVADTRAIVFDLESRLNAAEDSNKHIVDELKVLLADAEGTLIGSDNDSDSGESIAISSKHGSGSGDEDSNDVYNRICHALQSLIAEAQSALARTTSTASVTSSQSTSDQRFCRYHQPRLLLQQRHQQQLLMRHVTSIGGVQTPESIDDGECTCSCQSHSSGRTSRTSSISHMRTDRGAVLASATSLSEYSRLQAQSGRGAFSRMMWKEKQLEQYERYRQSCDRVSLELEMLLNDTVLEAEELLDDTYTSSTLDWKRPDERRDIAPHNESGANAKAFRSKGVGASRPQSIFMQLYALWKQTWLRKRLMHVLTESLELMLILWVVVKLSEASLAWMGIQMLKGGPKAWLTYIYGDQEGAGASVAKELYDKIRRDGFQLQRIRHWKRQESELLMKDFIASEAALAGMGMLQRTPFTPTGMVWAPVGRILAHAASGLALAYLSDNVRRIAKRL